MYDPWNSIPSLVRCCVFWAFGTGLWTELSAGDLFSFDNSLVTFDSEQSYRLLQT